MSPILTKLCSSPFLVVFFQQGRNLGEHTLCAMPVYPKTEDGREEKKEKERKKGKK